MKAEFINPFTEAAHYVLTETLQTPVIERGKLELRHDPHVSRGVSTIVGVNGQLRGHVIYDMDKKTALKVASVMNGEEMMGLDNIVRSTINELANMITGNAASKLSTAGYKCDITPPTFLIGDQAEIYAHKGMAHLIVPFNTACGIIHLSVAISENA